MTSPDLGCHGYSVQLMVVTCTQVTVQASTKLTRLLTIYVHKYIQGTTYIKQKQKADNYYIVMPVVPVKLIISIGTARAKGAMPLQIL